MDPSTTHSKTNGVSTIEEATEEFKQFDIVKDYSDHHFASWPNPDGSSRKGPSELFFPKTMAKKIMSEWKILEESLPRSIYFRVYEGRIDLLRAAIVGASGTPYHDGLFFFDLLFPSDYPAQPPLVHYRSYGISINANLYRNGDVCLSLLSTWVGFKKDERWNSSKSTVLQILLSIQALVLNEKPFFNEHLNGIYGILPRFVLNRRSYTYNQDIFALSCNTMLWVIHKKPRHFEDLVSAHFRERAQVILMASKAYMDGLADIGSLVENGSLSYSSARESKKFKIVMEELFPLLVMAFRRTGAQVEEFVDQVKTKTEVKEGCFSRIFDKVFEYFS